MKTKFENYLSIELLDVDYGIGNPMVSLKVEISKDLAIQSELFNHYYNFSFIKKGELIKCEMNVRLMSYIDYQDVQDAFLDQDYIEESIESLKENYGIEPIYDEEFDMYELSNDDCEKLLPNFIQEGYIDCYEDNPEAFLETLDAYFNSKEFQRQIQLENLIKAI